MSSQHDIVSVAALIADPTRTEMLLAMMDGTAHPASELAAIAHVTPATASHHLAQLTEGGLVKVFNQGRHRYHSLAGPEVAELLETLGGLGAPRVTKLKPNPLSKARTCYDHLAGRLGVEVRRAMEESGHLKLEGAGYVLSPGGEALLCELGIQADHLRSSRRAFAIACLDWTERVPHIGGALGSALYRRFSENVWILRGPISRAIELTPIGRVRLEEILGPLRL